MISSGPAPIVESYSALLRLPGVWRVFTAATIGRLSYATLSLSLLLCVQRATGSYAAAGASVGAFSLAGIGMPIKSRLVDRLGQRRVLPLMSAGFAAALAGTAAAAAGRDSSAPVYVILAGLAGLVAPPLGPTMRALWAALTPGSARQRAYSLDAVVEESAFAAGPLLVGVMITLANPATAVGVTALLNLFGTAALVSAPAISRHVTLATDQGRLLGPLRQSGFALLILVLFGVGLGCGPLDVAIVARAQQQAMPVAASYLLAVLAVGSIIGGLAWGRLQHHRSIAGQLATLVSALALSMAAAAMVNNLGILTGVLFAFGLATSPVFVLAYLAADRLVPDGSRTEATTWVSTGFNAGLALGASVAGTIIDHQTTTAALSFGTALLVATALLILTIRARLDHR